jgi:hypothetical protein
MTRSFSEMGWESWETKKRQASQCIINLGNLFRGNRGSRLSA